MFINFAMSRYRLQLSGFMICIPIMLSPGPDKFTAKLVELFNEIVALHAVTTNSSIFLT